MTWKRLRFPEIEDPVIPIVPNSKRASPARKSRHKILAYGGVYQFAE